MVLLSRQEQNRLHFQVLGRCPATHRDLTATSQSPDLLQTSTDPNFLWPCTDLGIAFPRDHGSKEFSWPQTSPLQQGLIQQRGRVWEFHKEGQLAMATNEQIPTALYRRQSRASCCEVLPRCKTVQEMRLPPFMLPPHRTKYKYTYMYTYSLFFPPKPIKVLQAQALSGRRLALKRPMK